jgi:hypothetical protein
VGENGLGGAAASLLHALYNEHAISISNLKEFIDWMTKLDISQPNKDLRFRDTDKGWYREIKAAYVNRLIVSKGMSFLARLERASCSTITAAEIF